MKLRMVLTMLLCCLLVFSSCQTTPSGTTGGKPNQGQKERIWAWSEINRAPIPPNAKAYPLADLIAFFGESTEFAEQQIFGSDINKIFPIEFYRRIGELEYVVYPVEEGGTFYAIFTHSESKTQIVSTLGICYYFDPTLTEEQFLSQIYPMRSTYADVKRCAPFSSIHPPSDAYEPRSVSYSLISKDLMAEIHYVEEPGDSGEPDLHSVVQEIRYYARQEDDEYKYIFITDLEYSVSKE